MKIGTFIRNLRISMGLSQEKVADKLGITKQAIYKYENNDITNIPMDKIKELAKIFYVTPSMIMGWENTIFNQLECSNRLKIINEASFYPPNYVSNILRMSESEYKAYENTYMLESDNHISDLATKLHLPHNFIIGESYETRRPFTEWRCDQREDWLNTNDAGKIILECKYGNPEFQPKTTSNIKITTTEQENTLLKAFRGTTEEGRMRIIQAVLNICDDIECGEIRAKSQSNAG